MLTDRLYQVSVSISLWLLDLGFPASDLWSFTWTFISLGFYARANYPQYISFANKYNFVRSCKWSKICLLSQESLNRNHDCLDILFKWASLLPLYNCWEVANILKFDHIFSYVFWSYHSHVKKYSSTNSNSVKSFYTTII